MNGSIRNPQKERKKERKTERFIYIYTFIIIVYIYTHATLQILLSEMKLAYDAAVLERNLVACLVPDVHLDVVEVKLGQGYVVHVVYVHDVGLGLVADADHPEQAGKHVSH